MNICYEIFDLAVLKSPTTLVLLKILWEVFVYDISRNFSKDPILALLAKLFSSLKLSIANNTPPLDIMCFMINLPKSLK